MGNIAGGYTLLKDRSLGKIGGAVSGATCKNKLDRL